MISLELKDFSLFADGVPILDGLNANLCGPGVVAMLGPSGAGKSSLLRGIQRLIEHGRDGWRRSGDILFDGKSTFARKVSRESLARRIGFIQQRPRMLAGSVRANVEFALKHTTKQPAEAIRTQAEHALEQVGLSWELPSLDMAAWKLSGGQAQRLAVARAIALEPCVLLMDEPTSSLDPLKTRQIEEIIRSQARQRLIVLVTHNPSLAGRVADQAVFLFRGDAGARIVESGPAHTVLKTPQDLSVREFIRANAGEQLEIEQPPAVSPRPARSNVPRPALGARLLQRVYLFVCGGNTSRSPIAQAFCRSEIARLIESTCPDLPDRSTFEVHSAGLTATPGEPVDPKANAAIETLGCQPTDHAAQVVSQDIVDRADAIYCMTDNQCRTLSKLFPTAVWKLQRLDPLTNIPNPHNGNLEIFRNVAARIRDLVRWRLESQLRFPLSEGGSAK